MTIASQEPPPRRFVAGIDAIGTAGAEDRGSQEQIDANRDLATSLAFDDERP